MLKDQFVKLAREANMKDDFIDRMWEVVPARERPFINDFVAKRAIQKFLSRVPAALKPNTLRN